MRRRNLKNHRTLARLKLVMMSRLRKRKLRRLRKKLFKKIQRNSWRMLKKWINLKLNHLMKKRIHKSLQ